MAMNNCMWTFSAVCNQSSFVVGYRQSSLSDALSFMRLANASKPPSWLHVYVAKARNPSVMNSPPARLT
eukprot:CAMPEP_0170446440 /NCGR_PEP_ID=MMETSP0117_2-20130122/49604_1 /TAXON_ID=400756 /ORGANISM="Durinskia baltica, Strain CSIRO CS-38" /LENGTH=68 /DNA_ID=CAMNT_0010707399 /DNA_START=123 /DNA_END=325 /DNA_ORIENTATION=-